jgi:hypothetical protein
VAEGALQDYTSGVDFLEEDPEEVVGFGRGVVIKGLVFYLLVALFVAHVAAPGYGRFGGEV